MNTSKTSPNKTQNGSSASRKALTFAYRVGSGIYMNLTNRCTNDCVFCLRRNGDSAYGSDPLWLEREPTPDEAFSAVKAIYFPGCKEFVFCGYGEPLCRAEALIETAQLLKSAYPDIPIRINTNGQADLICKKDIVPSLAGTIDSVSVSLNTPDAEKYVLLCRPVFGKEAFEAIANFAKRCAAAGIKTAFSVVKETLTGEEIAACRDIAANAGAVLRVRDYISENNQNDH